VTAFLAGLALSVLSSVWAIACAGRRPVLAALTEGAWAAAVAIGVGAADTPVTVGLFALGCSLGTYGAVRYA
jgi:hypothetical protein